MCFGAFRSALVCSGSLGQRRRAAFVPVLVNAFVEEVMPPITLIANWTPTK
jgi:hypothetical protein